MKRFIILLSLLFCNVVFADTINLHWLNEDGTVYENSTCVIDSDLILPATPPTKYGYTFTGWKLENYIPIEYLESTGTQWIDTGVVANGEFIAKYKFNISSLPSTSSGYFIGGARGANQHLNFGQINDYTNAVLAYLNKYWNFNIPSVENITEIEVVYKNGEQYCLIDNKKYAQQNLAGTEILNLNIYLFRRNHYSSADDTNTNFKGKIYYFKLWNNDILVRDFIPVLDNTGTPCMFDKVEGKFYYNVGTGQFIAGPVVEN